MYLTSLHVVSLVCSLLWRFALVAVAFKVSTVLGALVGISLAVYVVSNYLIEREAVKAENEFLKQFSNEFTKKLGGGNA